MNRSRAGRCACIFGVLLAAPFARADSWLPPSPEVTTSANGRFRVTVTPRPLSSSLAYFEDKVEGADPAGQREGEAQTSPLARVERLDASDVWHLVWQMPLVNDVGPTSALLADDASFLVTFDNWHSVGYGDDVVVIYDRRGDLVRKLSLEQILPAAYLPHLSVSVSSRWWGGEHRLVEGDRQVELQILEPGYDDIGDAEPAFAPVRIRLEDGVVLPPGGAAWDRAMARATALESTRQAEWEALRRLRTSALDAPLSRVTKAWRIYMFELRDRIADEDEDMGGMVLPAPGEARGFHDARAIAGWVERYDKTKSYARSNLIVASPISDQLAAVLVEALLERPEGAMEGAHLVFVGTPAEGAEVTAAAARSGARVTVVDRTVPFPAGEPLPPTPHPMWMPMSMDF